MSNEKVVLTESVYYILLSLMEPMHGYGIMKNITRMSNSRINMGPGTLYGAINTLLKKNWIETVKNPDDSRKKLYKITDNGLLILENEIARLEELIVNGKKIMKWEED